MQTPEQYIYEKAWTQVEAYALNRSVEDNIECGRIVESLQKSMGTGTLLDLHVAMMRKYGKPLCGTGRAVYISKFVVFKIPLNEAGFRANDVEISLCYVPEIPLAHTRYVKAKGIEVLAMQRVKEVTYDQIIEREGFMPKFVSAVDMAQVGYTRKNKLVAFDYGDMM